MEQPDRLKKFDVIDGKHGMVCRSLVKRSCAQQISKQQGTQGPHSRNSIRIPQIVAQMSITYRHFVTCNDFGSHSL